MKEHGLKGESIEISFRTNQATLWSFNAMLFGVRLVAGRARGQRQDL